MQNTSALYDAASTIIQDVALGDYWDFVVRFNNSFLVLFFVLLGSKLLYPVIECLYLLAQFLNLLTDVFKLFDGQFDTVEEDQIL